MKVNKKPIVVVVSGGMDPIHIGHIRLTQEARKLGDRLVVILNNDNWLRKKKVNIFMHQKERKEILESIEGVDEVIITSHPKNPKDMSVAREILKIKPDIFANGGDRKSEKDIPEAEACKKVGCRMVFNVGRGGKVQSSSWLLTRYVTKIKKPRKFNIARILRDISYSLKDSKVAISVNLKLRVSELMLDLMKRKVGFGLFVILGWDNKWKDHTDLPDAEQDIYIKHHINILTHYKTHKYDIGTTINFDGAILIDSKGNIVRSGIIIEGLKPRVIANKINPGKFRDLSEQFGFKKKVHSRHLSAIAASYIFKGTTVMTVSEETNSFHIFEGGRIAHKMYDD